ncbi:MAG: hypothetical protein ACK4UN_15630, partial [Limisphaerales bacterium]
MFNQLKSFLSRAFSKQPEVRPEAPRPAEAKEAPQTAAAAGKAAPASRPPVPATKAPAAPAPVAAPLEPGEEVFTIPVKVVVSQFSADLTGLVKATGNANLNLPLKRILSQLPQGVVKLSFGEIRQAAPAGTFLDVTSQDQTTVSLPLPEVLSRLSSAHLARRPAQKTIEVPEEVGNVFGPRGEQLQQASAKAAPAAAPVQAKAPAPAAPAPKPAPAAPKVAVPPAAPKVEPATRIAAPTIPAQGLPKAAPAPAPAVAQDQTPASGDVLTIPLVSLIENWPQNVKDEVSSSKLGDSSVALPMNRIEAGLKTGKLAFQWREIAEWLKPAPFTSQLNADTAVELPLKVVAPLFIAQHRPVKQQKKLAIDETIPDVFAGG